MMREGDQLGSYLLEKLLVRNERTTVFLASRQEEGGAKAWCVLRCVNPRSADSAFTRAFIADARSAFQISHPNVVRALEVGAVEGEAFVAMERLRGVDLLTAFGQAKRSGQPVPVDVTLWAAHEVLEGLRHIHGRKGPGGGRLLHRNVSLPNLFITDHGAVKLLDLGVSGAQGAVYGRPDYIAPEQGRGEQPDAASDLFSLGVVMHELFTGHRMFQRDGGKVQRSFSAPASIRSASSIRRDLPPQVETIVTRALCHDPAERYQSATEMQADIREQLLGEPAEGREKLSIFVAERFEDELGEADEMTAGGLESSGAAAEREKPMNDGDWREAASSGKAKAEKEKKAGPSIAAMFFGLVALAFILGVVVFIYMQERQGPAPGSYEAWKESFAGKMAEPRPFVTPSGEEESSTKVASEPSKRRSGAAKASAGRPVAKEPIPDMDGQLLVVCSGRCRVFVDGERVRADPDSGPATLPVGPKRLRIVDVASSREVTRDVLIAPNRVHVENVEFTPTFMERTGTEEW